MSYQNKVVCGLQRDIPCGKCELSKYDVNCKAWTIKQIGGFWGIVFVFVSGSLGVILANTFLLGNWWAIIGWAISSAYISLAEIYTHCIHCPHAMTEGKGLTCPLNRNLPIKVKYNPNPMSFIEKVILMTSYALYTFFPLSIGIYNVVYFASLGSSYLLLVVVLLVYDILSIVVFFGVMFPFYCSKCVLIECPWNQLSRDVSKLVNKSILNKR